MLIDIYITLKFLLCTLPLLKEFTANMFLLLGVFYC